MLEHVHVVVDRTRTFSVPSPAGIAPRPLARLLLLVLVAATSAGCRSQGTPEAVDVATAEPAVAIVGPCAAPAAIHVPVPEEGDAWQAVSIEPKPECFSITAADVDAAGVGVGSGFVLSSAVPLSPDDVAMLVRVEPPVRLAVAERTARRALRGPGSASEARQLEHAYDLQPEEPLDPGTVYRFALHEAPGGDMLSAWSFQTRAPLSVVQTLPDDQASGVPLNTGIEITFSHDGVSGAQDAFSITPDAPGSFESHGRTLVFVPERLDPETLYTVRLEPGVSVEGSDLALAEPFELWFETGVEERSGEAPPTGPALRFSRASWEQPTEGAPVMSLFSTGQSEVATTNVPVTAYRYDAVEGFLSALDAYAAIPTWAWATRSTHRAETDRLVAAVTFDAELRPLGEYGEYLLAFPDTVAEGFYLVEAMVAGGPAQAWLQVTDVGAYAAVADDRLLVWVNDVGTGRPIAGAEVLVDGATFETDADGIAFVDTPEDVVTVEHDPYGYARTVSRGDLVVIAPSGATAVVPLSDAFRGTRAPGYRDWRGVQTADLYWRYLYSDRALYRLSDTIHFWGIARGRDGGPAVTSATVELRGGAYTGLDYEEPVLARTEVLVGPSGTYSGTLSFSAASPGFYSLRLAVGDDEVASTGLELRDFVKPAYRIEAEPARRAVFAGETVSVTVAAAFFEGSPVPGLDLAVHGDGDHGESVVTDAAGMAELAYRTPRNETPYGYGWSTLYFRPARAEEGQMSASSSVVVVPAAVAVEAEGSVSEEGGEIRGNVRAVDLDRVNAGAVADPTDFLAEAVPEHEVIAEVVEIVQRAVETGTTYDFTSKRTVKAFRYETEELPFGTFDTLTDGAGDFVLPFPASPGGQYRVTVRSSDAQGRSTGSDLYLGPSYQYGPPGEVLLDATTTGPYGISDSVEIEMRAGNEDLPEGDAYLFVRARNGILDFTRQASPRYAFQFAEGHVPNVHVLAVRFTGGTYQEAAWSYDAAFDSSERALRLDLSTDRARYAPGDEVKLDVAAFDADGRPTSATVLLSAVDAAIVQLQGGGTGDAFRSSLYASAGSGVVRTYASHQYPRGTPGAEGGGGGDGRSDFRDVVLFEEVTTGIDGRAVVTFRVPDNLTSWSVTALGVTEDLEAGSGFGEVPVGIPLFVDLTMNETYLVDDRPVLRLRAYGDGLAEGASVSFELSSETLAASPIQVEGTAFEAVEVPLPPLVEGHHVIRAAATSGDLIDAVSRPMTVLPSRLSAARTESTELTPGETFTPDVDADRGVTLVVSDANRGRYYADLVRLGWTYGDRLDQVLARDVAGTLLTAYFTSTQSVASGVRPEVYQTAEGGAALLPYGDADLTLSARVASVDPDALGRQGLVQYFTAVLDDADATQERRVEALYGLASLGAPVLTGVAAALAEIDPTTREELQLGLAALALGDEPSAARVYRSVLSEHGLQRGSRIRLDIEGDRDAVMEVGLLAARLGAGLGESTAAALYEDVASDRPAEDVLALDEAGYLRAAMPRLAETVVTLAYDRHGKREEATLEPGRSLTLPLTAEELAVLDLEVIDGRALVAVTTLEPIDAAAMSSDPEVTLERSYVLESAAPGRPPELPAVGDSSGLTQIGDGDLVRVELRYRLGEKAASGCYQLSDLLPSGLRPVSAPYDAGAYYEGVGDPTLVFPYDVRGQRVSFCVYRDGEQDTLGYLARVVTTGTYVAEPALVQSMEVPESLGLSAPSSVEIR